MKFNSYTELFPMMSDDELESLAGDILLNGLHEPITTYRDEILDGRNRYAACVIAKVEPTFKEYQGDDSGLLAFVISANLRRRHLSETQRARIAADVANMNVGRPNNSQNFGNISQSQAAEMFNVSDELIRQAARVRDDGIQELDAMMRQDKVAASAAAKIANRPKDFQRKVVEKLKEGIKPTEAVRQVVGESYADNKLEPGEKKYRIVYADPPWHYGNTSADYLTEQRDHYRTMPLDEICEMPVKSVVEDDAVLFLWTTSPMLEESFEVIAAWGFGYKASFIWDKQDHVMGHYNSVRHELLLVCTRGSCLPDVHKLHDSVLSIKRGEHSTKPKEFREIIDSIYTYGNKIELFAREQIDGWEVYGNDVSGLKTQ